MGAGQRLEQEQESDHPDKTAVVGAGTMGHGIAATFAMKGYCVSLYDIDESKLQKAEQQMTAIADRFYPEGRLDQEAIKRSMTGYLITMISQQLPNQSTSLSRL